MTLRHFEIYTEVCRQESITRAAEILNIAQPSVSLAIKELEVYYGCKLFERMNRRLYITAMGRQLWDYAESILSQCDEIRDLLNENNDHSAMRLGTNISFANGYLADLVDALRENYPSMEITVSVRNSRQIEEALLQNQMDIGIMDHPTDVHHLVIHPLLEEKMLMLCSKEYPLQSGHPITCDELLSHPMLVREPGSGTRTILENLSKETHVPLKIAMESTSDLGLLQACLHGQGLLFLPQSTYEHLSISERLRTISFDCDPALQTRSYYVAHHKNKFLSKGMKQFISFLSQM